MHKTSTRTKDTATHITALAAPAQLISHSFQKNLKHLKSALLCVLFALLLTFQNQSQAKAYGEFHEFLETIWPEARAKGVSRSTFLRAIGGLTPDPSIMKSQTSQPEFVSPVWAYIDRAVSEERLKRGKEMLVEQKELLKQLEQRFGVERQILLAIWGLESTFGKNKGDKDIIRSLATMAYRGGRKRFGRKELVAALQILERGDIPLSEFKGSWAGAMGHTQFIPSTYNAYAVDFTGDGKRDIWTSTADALASTANYLRRFGWQTGKTWGYEVILPNGYDYTISGLGKKKRLRDWARLGIKRANGSAFPRPDDVGELVLPAGARGPAFLVLKNFRVIMRYNVSVSYVLAVGHLGDRILGFSPFIRPWPKEDRRLKYVEQKEIQSLLAQKGYKIGKIDGKIGGRTKRALRDFQRRNGIPADGHPSYAILQRLRN
jgi:membrane-bound lytic murein transglycosylase B